MATQAIPPRNSSRGFVPNGLTLTQTSTLDDGITEAANKTFAVFLVMSPAVHYDPREAPSAISKANTELLRQQHERAEVWSRAEMEKMIAEHINKPTQAQYEEGLRAAIEVEAAACKKMEDEQAAAAKEEAERVTRDLNEHQKELLGDEILGMDRKSRIEALRSQVSLSTHPEPVLQEG